MGAVVADWRSHHGEQAGLVGLSSGLDALGARLRMLEQAQKSVDAQYFILKRAFSVPLTGG
jgi:putative cardiolipin synthase